jgi:protein SCO1/2
MGKSEMPKRATLLWGLAGLAAVVLAVVAALNGGFQPKSAQQSAAVGGPFTMVDQTGAAVDEAVLKGKWSAVFFGFTYCPDVCPTTMQALAVAQDRLGPKGEELQVIFVSVDPERDTPAQLAAYLKSDSLPRNVRALTGSPEQVAAIAKAYHVYYRRNGEGEGYLVDHSTPTYLMDPKGRFNRIIPYNLPPEEIARQISDAMRAG